MVLIWCFHASLTVLVLTNHHSFSLTHCLVLRCVGLQHSFFFSATHALYPITIHLLQLFLCGYFYYAFFNLSFMFFLIRFIACVFARNMNRQSSPTPHHCHHPVETMGLFHNTPTQSACTLI